MADLKPCPFCGKAPNSFASKYAAPGWCIVCENFDCIDVSAWVRLATEKESKAAAIARWNRRANPSDSPNDQPSAELAEFPVDGDIKIGRIIIGCLAGLPIQHARTLFAALRRNDGPAIVAICDNRLALWKGQ